MRTLTGLPSHFPAAPAVAAVSVQLCPPGNPSCPGAGSGADPVVLAPGRAEHTEVGELTLTRIWCLREEFHPALHTQSPKSCRMGLAGG